VSHTSEAVVRRTFKALVRHASEYFVGHEAVVRHIPEAQLSSQIEHSSVAFIHLPDSQLHLLLICTSVPLPLNEVVLFCQRTPATTPFSLRGSHPFSLAIHYHLFYLVESHVSSVAEMASLNNRK
jgi:hypothetical protein